MCQRNFRGTERGPAEIDVTCGLDGLLNPQAEGHAGNQVNCCQPPQSPDAASAEACSATEATDLCWVWFDRTVAGRSLSPAKPQSSPPEEALTADPPERRRSDTHELTTQRLRKEIQWQSLVVARSSLHGTPTDNRLHFGIFCCGHQELQKSRIMVSDAPCIRL